ncbi:MAG: DUF3168 domain-containing protein [Sphingopyxis sp.]
MRLEEEARLAVRAALADHPMLAVNLNRIGDGEGDGAPVPSAWIGDAQGNDWGVKDAPGREIRLGITLADRGDSARLADLASAAEAAIRAMPRRLGAWDTSGPTITTTRLTRRRDGTRLALIDLRLRGWLAA